MLHLDDHHTDRRPARRRWAALGTVLAVLLGGSGALHQASADVGSGDRAVFVPISPCRLADTRPATLVGTRGAPLSAGTFADFQVRGVNGNCTIPNDALSVQMNVTIVNPTAAAFLTLWPSDAGQPTAANLNWVAGQAATPNSVTVKLSSTGAIRAFINSGTVDLIIDVAGYDVGHHHDDRYYTKSQIGAIYTLDTGDVTIAPGTYTSGTLTCPVGTYPVGTGSSTLGYLNFVLIYSNFVGYFLANQASSTGKVAAQAVCMQGTKNAPGTVGLQPVAADDAWQADLTELIAQAEAAGLTPAAGS